MHVEIASCDSPNKSEPSIIGGTSGTRSLGVGIRHFSGFEVGGSTEERRGPELRRVPWRWSRGRHVAFHIDRGPLNFVKI
jgi:hypothetical protein